MHIILTLLIFGPTVSLSLDISSFRKFSKPSNSFSKISSEKCVQQQKIFSTAIDYGDRWSLQSKYAISIITETEKNVAS